MVGVLVDPGCVEQIQASSPDFYLVQMPAQEMSMLAAQKRDCLPSMPPGNVIQGPWLKGGNGLWRSLLGR